MRLISVTMMTVIESMTSDESSAYWMNAAKLYGDLFTPLTHCLVYTVYVTETWLFWNRRTAVVLVNCSLENVIRTVMLYIYNARSTVRQRALCSTKTDVSFQLLLCAQ